MADWAYDARRRRYLRDGQVVTQAEMVAIRDALIDASRAEVVALTALLIDGSITVWQWEEETLRRLSHIGAAQYLLGVGGVASALIDYDEAYGEIVGWAAGQAGYLRGFVDDLIEGSLTEGQIAARAALYVGATRVLFDVGRAQSWGFDLPAFPGDGDTECGTNCQCHWEFYEVEDGIDAYWRTASNPCPGCVVREQNYSPFSIRWGDDAGPDTV